MQDSKGLIFPEIINNSHSQVYAFFTNRLFQQDPSAFIAHRYSAGLLMPVQRHTDIVVSADELINNQPVEADAVITNKPNVFIGIKTADCVPVLIFDPCHMVIGAVHAGWRGIAQWILSKTIKQMVAHYGSSARELLVAIGPSIGPCCYKVGPEVAEMITEGRDNTCVVEHGGCYHADLQRANIIEALKFGVREDNIWCCPECTCCLPDKYYSYRYGKEKSMRQYGIIGFTM